MICFALRFVQFSGNISPLLKAIRLYDYNRDGKILMKDLQSALDQVGVRFSDQQFEKCATPFC